MLAHAPIRLDGSLDEWSLDDRIDRGVLPTGYTLSGTSDTANFYLALTSATAIGANTTVWLNTDRNAATGYQVFGFAGGAEYNVNIAADGTASLYSGAAGQTLVAANLQIGRSPDGKTLEIQIPKSAIGSPQAIDVIADVNDSVFLPGSYSDRPFTVFGDSGIVPDAGKRVAIVYSETTAKNYFSETAYGQLFMAAQSQVTQAGLPFDILTEKDLTSLTTLAKYDTIVFPSFRNVDAAQASLITNTLEQATKQFGIGLVAAGEFMTNAADNSALPGDSYARMKLLFDATRVGGGFPADVTVKATDGGVGVFDNFAQGEVVRDYKGVGWTAITSVSGQGATIATETVGGQTYAAALATQTGGRNVIFSSEAVMADSNLLWQAVDYATNGNGISVGLQMTRDKAIVAARNDMDQSQYRDEVNPANDAAGIYDKMLPILDQWKKDYGFVGSYYVNVGNNPAVEETTDWAVSGAYYKKLLDMGNELGTHSYTHPADTNLLTPTQVAFEFGQSKAVIEAEMSKILGRAFTITGAAVPGAPEGIVTSQEILKYVDYLSGGYSGVGAGYPGAIGFIPVKSAVGPELIVNGSFEQAPVAANAWRINGNGQVAGWTGSRDGIEVWNNGFMGVKPTAGLNVVEVDAMNGALTQAVATEAGKTYTLSFDYAGRPGALPSSTFEVVWNGNVLATIAPTGSTMTAKSLTVTGTGGNDTVQFRAVAGDTDNYGALLDNVSLKSLVNGTSFNQVYIAPNTSFDFTLVGFQGKTAEQAAAAWATEWNQLTAKAEVPVVVWPWHDYGPTLWDTDNNGQPSRYSLAMFTDWISRAAAAGSEFVTLADLAERTAAIAKSTLTTSVVGNVVTATVGSGDAGRFALDVDGQGSKVIQKVAGWYAYDDQKVFLPTTGGTFTITLGATADDVTHITDLPMRSELKTVTGDGRNLNFSLVGEGKVTVDLAASGTDWTTITGATVASRVGDVVTLDVGANGTHDVGITYVANVAPVLTSNGGRANVALSIAENGTAVTTIAASDANLAQGDRVHYALGGAADADRFSIDATTGVLKFIAAPDFEAPLDRGGDNVYDVTVLAIDERGASVAQALAVRVADVAGITAKASIFGGTLNGTGENDNLSATLLKATLNGLGGNDLLTGASGEDTLNGGDGNDVLVGLGNADRLTGGAGNDIFRLTSTRDSGESKGSRDVITDFQQGQDRIDLSMIDANSSSRAPGDQAFTLMSGVGGKFTTAAQLRYSYVMIDRVEHTMIEGTTDTGSGAEFSLALVGHFNLTPSDFML